MERKLSSSPASARSAVRSESRSAARPRAIGPGPVAALQALRARGASGDLSTQQRAVGPRAVLQRMPLPALQLEYIGAAPNRLDDPDHVRRAARVGIAGSGGPLPHLDTIQRSFGEHDVSSVKSHTGEGAAAAARAIGAAAYTMDGHVAFSSTPDLHTAAHEAAHVVQQRAGVQLAGGVGEVGDRYERHADAVADAVVQGRSSAALLSQFSGAAQPIQMRATGDSAGPRGAIQMMYIGNPGRHHMHVDIAQPHYKNGNDVRSRINIGSNQDYRQADLELVIETIKGRAREPGAQACIDWCRAECRKLIDAAGGRTALRRA